MSKLRIAVIGCGSIARHRHIPEYAAHPDVELVAFCDVVPERANFFANQYHATAYSNYEDLLANEKLDAVSVCLPNYLHAPVSIKAAQSGVHVLCEKPMATTADEARAMIQAAEEHHVFLMIGHNQRFMPPHQKAKEILKRGYLGRVISFRTAFGHPGPESWSVDGKNSWFFRKNEAVMGAMGDLGVHKADLIRYLLDDEVSEVGAIVDTLAKNNTDVDDNAVCILKTKKGVIGTLAASWSYQQEDNSTILYCEHGVLRLAEDPVNQVVVSLHDGSIENYQVGAVATNEKQVTSGVIDDFIHAIQTGTKPSISGEEGLRSLSVVLAMIESSDKKTFITVQP